jgi:hypothetical protein
MTRNQNVLGIVLAFVLTSPTIALSEETGTSCADCPSYQAAFSIENETGVAIPYQYKWGEKGHWHNTRLESGRVNTHSWPLGEDKNAKIHAPFVRFDKIGGDAQFEEQDYRMEFYAVGYAGYGPNKANTEPKKYYFKYEPDGKHIRLLAR